MAEQTRICEWCSTAFTHTPTGPGRPPPYCSSTCKAEAQRALNAGRVRRKRARDRAQQHVPQRPVGRPPKG